MVTATWDKQLSIGEIIDSLDEIHAVSVAGECQSVFKIRTVIYNDAATTCVEYCGSVFTAVTPADAIVQWVHTACNAAQR